MASYDDDIGDCCDVAKWVLRGCCCQEKKAMCYFCGVVYNSGEAAYDDRLLGIKRIGDRRVLWIRLIGRHSSLDWVAQEKG